VANQNPDEIAILPGNGDGTFGAPTQFYSTGGNAPVSVAVGDINGDGKLDIVVANRCGSNSNCSSGNVGVLLGNGDGTFQPAMAFNSGVNTTRVFVSDLNGDGRADLIVLDGSTFDVLLGSGDGTFRGVSSYGSGRTDAPDGLAVGDLNGDGKPDVVISDYSAPKYECGESTAVFLNNGDGTFQSPIILDSQGLCPLAVGIADLNGDGKPDLVVANECTQDLDCSVGSLILFLGNGDGTFPAAQLYSSTASADSLGFADLDGDGRLDVVVTGIPGIVGGNSIFLGNGNGILKSAMVYSQPSGGNTVVAADLNGDGKPDLVMADGDTVDVLINGATRVTSTTSMTSSLNPVQAGRDVTYTVTITTEDGSQASGLIFITDNVSNTQPCSGLAVNNQLICTTGYRTKYAGEHFLTAIYEGDGSHWGSISPVFSEYVQVHSTTRVTTSGSPSHAGQAVTFTATVKSRKDRIPNETVSFYDKKTLLGTAQLSNGSASITTSSLSVGKHTIKAVYPGDNQFGPSHGSVKQVVEQ